jgi:DNA-directed RNA polymerase specialized sigma24 family protein
MTRDEVGKLFVEMQKEVSYAAGKWLKGDRDAREGAAHDALLLALEQSFATPEEAHAFILGAAEQAGFLLFQRRREERHRFPQPRHWVLEGRHMALPPAAGGDEQEDHLDNLPDTRPDPEEEAIRKECEETIAALARRLGHDPSWRGELYRLMYVEGKGVAETARILGISEKTAQKRVERLKEYLQESKEGKQVVKGRRG